MMNGPLIASFSRGMGQGSVENYEFLYKLKRDYIRGLPKCNMVTLKELKSSLSSRLIY